MDKLILQSIDEAAIDTVVDLGSGLDTRPFRLPLPASLTWIEVDLPDVLAYKARELSGYHPACALESVELDIGKSGAGEALFARMGSRAKRVLVVSEGLLAYLTRDQVSSLASHLYARSQVVCWLSDIVSATALRLMGRLTGHSLQSPGITLRFAPEEGPAFFQPFGWEVAELHSLVEESRRLERWFLPVTLLFASLSAAQWQVLRELFSIVRLRPIHRRRDPFVCANS
jgi:methyltransferase (TIGR00027 family)